MQEAQATLEVSERRACQVIGQPRSTQRYVAQERDGEKSLVQRMLALVGRHPRYGYRRIWALLRSEGFRVNVKRVYRLWRREGLKVPKKQRKKRRLGCSVSPGVDTGLNAILDAIALGQDVTITISSRDDDVPGTVGDETFVSAEPLTVQGSSGFGWGRF